MRRKSLAEERCPIARSLDILGDWWTLLIVRDALGGVRRFNDFQRSLGAARGSLTTRLKTLVEREILEIRPASDGSSFHEYVLTPKGQELAVVLTSLAQWGTAHAFQPDESVHPLLDRKTGLPLKKLELRAIDGRQLDANDVQFPSGMG